MQDESVAQKEKLTCFVVMGFGIKTDLATGRQLDLNKTYKVLIKPVVESKNLTCVRADEIMHSGPIDLYMYQQLLDADIVIADISTANVNAFYELGIRHALRQRTTIVISEDKLAYPFDLNHIKIASYTHLGSAIDYEEVERFRKVLGDTIDAVLQVPNPDSPVYTHLQELIPPSMQKKVEKALEQLEAVTVAMTEDEQQTPAESGPINSLALLIDQGEDALEKRAYKEAASFFKQAIHEMNKHEGHLETYDPYLVQRLAYATYKAKEPDNLTALREAMQLLHLLDLDNTNDTETVTLAGKIEKRLYRVLGKEEHLNNAILFYQRGYYLFHSRYHGINLAYLLNKRVDSSIYTTTEDKIADMVWASRTRREVLEMCEQNWKQAQERKYNNIAAYKNPTDQIFAASPAAGDEQEQFWILVNKAEAHFGLGQKTAYNLAVNDAMKIEHTQWMLKSFTDQLEELSGLLKKHGHYINLSV
jgi:hypothetical protein